LHKEYESRGEKTGGKKNNIVKSGTLIETHEFKVPKSIRPKNKSKSKSKGVGFDREIVSAEKKLWLIYKKIIVMKRIQIW